MGLIEGRAANNSSGGLHGTYVKQTKAFSLIRFVTKTKVRPWRTNATEDEESPQVCLSFLGVPFRSLQDSS